MIFGVLRLLLFAAAGLSVVYLLVSIYSRSVRREALEKRFDRGDVPGDRAAYIRDGMAAYEKSLRRRLIWLVFVIPIAAIGVTVYLVNHE